MAAEAGKTVDQGDPEVSEADRLRALLRRPGRASSTTVDGAPFAPVAAHRRHPAVELPGRDPGRLDARGARRRLRRHHQARAARPGAAARCMVEALWEAGVPRDVLAAASQLAERELGRQLVARPGVGPRDPHRRRIETAELFRGFRPRPAAAGRDQRQERDHRHARPPTSTSPSKDVVVRPRSGTPGQKCSAASLVDPGRARSRRSERFRRQLVDAVALAARSGCAGGPRDRGSGPLIEPAEGKLLRGAHHARARARAGWSSRGELDDDGPAVDAPASATASRRGSRVPPRRSTSARCSAS